VAILTGDQRQFKFLTIFGFGVLLGNTWEFSMMYAACVQLSSPQLIKPYSGIGISLYNGGPAGGIWLLVVVCFGMFFVTLSLAEMVSM
jgi:hypothetical protein